MEQIENYAHRQGGYPVKAVRLTAKNASLVEEWCNGVAFLSYDALNGDSSEQALNFPGKDGMVRLRENEFLVLSGEYFKRYSGIRFKAEFKRVK